MMTLLNRFWPHLLVATLVVGLLWKTYDAGKDAQAAAQVARELAAVKWQVQSEQAARAADALLTKAAHQRNAALTAKIEELNDTLEDAGRECLTGADTDRLRKLWAD